MPDPGGEKREGLPVVQVPDNGERVGQERVDHRGGERRKNHKGGIFFAEIQVGRVAAAVQCAEGGYEPCGTEAGGAEIRGDVYGGAAAGVVGEAGDNGLRLDRVRGREPDIGRGGESGQGLRGGGHAG